MAIPERHDVDYFPFYVKRGNYVKRGKTLNILQSEYGNEGIGFFTNVMRFFATVPDHHYSIKKESDKRNFFAEIGITDKEKGIAMIKLMVETEKLDKELWEKYQVIVCPAFIESVKDAYKNRRNKIITIEEIREKYQNSEFGETETPKNVDFESDNSYSSGFPSKNEGNNPQTKLKETKLKESSQSMTDAFSLAGLLLSLHRKEISDYLSGKNDKKTIENWAEDIEKLIRLDKKPPDVIRHVIEWVKAPGCFWFPNIQSGSKLRKQFEMLYSQMIADNKKKGKSSQPNAHKIASDNIPDEKLDEYFN
jgi:hypothetical protein